MRWIYVLIGGGLGAITRYAISLFFASYLLKFPFHTLIANVLASFILGFVFGFSSFLETSAEFKLLIGTGFCGGLSTFSTYAAESFFMAREQEWFYLILNFFLNNILSFLFLFLGFFLGGKIAGVFR